MNRHLLMMNRYKCDHNKGCHFINDIGVLVNWHIAIPLNSLIFIIQKQIEKMRKISFLLLLIPHLLPAQTYKQLTDSALTIMNSNAQDSASQIKLYTHAYALYQKALTVFPAQREKIAYYKAGYLAGELGYKDPAFNYLNNAIDNGMYDIVLWKYATHEFKAVANDLRWIILVSKAKQLKDVFLKQKIALQKELEANSPLNNMGFAGKSALEVYRMIKTYDTYPKLTDQFISMTIPLTDSLHNAYLIVLPEHYDHIKKYPLMFSLHGAVSGNTGYMDYADSDDTGGWNRFYTKYAAINNVIMVYPRGNKDYNWMYPDKGFFMIPAILKQMKEFINIDDNRVFITGHSNGATGSFSYLMKQPSPFAAFYGFNTRPRVATGGTFVRNILNRSYFNVSTDSDYYYPPNANDSLFATMKQLGADYQDHRYNGFPHWFPAFDASEPAHRLLFADLAKRSRDPFHHSIYWECDDLKYSTCDWLQITALDTTAKRADWQRDINFKIRQWKIFGPKDKLITRDTMLDAFKYNKRSGAVKATFINNVFTVETSDVKSFRILLSPEMIDQSRTVIVIVNGKPVKRQKLSYDKDFMTAAYKATLDRMAVWVNFIDVDVP